MKLMVFKFYRFPELNPFQNMIALYRLSTVFSSSSWASGGFSPWGTHTPTLASCNPASAFVVHLTHPWTCLQTGMCSGNWSHFQVVLLGGTLSSVTAFTGIMMGIINRGEFSLASEQSADLSSSLPSVWRRKGAESPGTAPRSVCPGLSFRCPPVWCPVSFQLFLNLWSLISLGSL